MSKSADTVWRHSLKKDFSDFYGCEVCWTCYFFEVQDNKCAMMPGPQNDYASYTYNSKIKDPGWFRCKCWKSKDEHKKER